MTLDNQIKELEKQALRYPRMRTDDVVRILKHIRDSQEEKIKSAYEDGFQDGAKEAANEVGSLL